MQIQPNSRLLFIGDSITDCGRVRPIGSGASPHALGDGFVSLVDAALTAAYPDYAISTINMGCSGNTIRDLQARWKTDVLDLAPDWLVIKIGINDVWQHIDPSWGTGDPISAHEYSQTLHQLILQIRPSLHGLILMTPYYLETNTQQPMRTMIDKFGGAVGEAAIQHNALLVDTQAAFDHVLQWMPPQHFAADRVHVNLAGHMVLAHSFLGTIGFSWQRSIPSGSGNC